MNVISVDLQCIHFFSFTCVILHFNNHIINKSHMICSHHNYVLVLGVWSLLRQTGMGNSPWQFEAVHRTTWYRYPWVTLEGRATWSTGNPQSTQKRHDFLKIGVNGSAGILCKILQVIITSGKLK